MSDVNGEQTPEFLRERELATRWRLTSRTLQRWRSKGTGPGWTRFGRRIVYHRSTVLEWERQAERGGDTRR